MGRPVVEAPYAVATRQENWRLLQAIDEALAAMERDGTLDALVDEWLRGDR
jgi:ABC-type amino acid transport substrate-binding protein